MFILGHFRKKDEPPNMMLQHATAPYLNSTGCPCAVVDWSEPCLTAAWPTMRGVSLCSLSKY